MENNHLLPVLSHSLSKTKHKTVNFGNLNIQMQSSKPNLQCFRLKNPILTSPLTYDSAHEHNHEKSLTAILTSKMSKTIFEKVIKLLEQSEEKEEQRQKMNKRQSEYIMSKAKSINNKYFNFTYNKQIPLLAAKKQKLPTDNKIEHAYLKRQDKENTNLVKISRQFLKNKYLPLPKQKVF